MIQDFDLVVIGGGVFGMGTAVEAGRRGRRVVLVDRRPVPNPIAASYGPSRKIRSTYLDPHYSKLVVEAMGEWRRIEAETGRELYVAIGNLAVGDGSTDEHLATLHDNARAGGARVRWLETADLRREFPQFRHGTRALLEADAGFLRATDCVAALRTLAERHGVKVVAEQEARLESSANGVAVRAGDVTYRAPHVVVAAGGWSKRLFPELGDSLWQCQQGIMYLEGRARGVLPAGVHPVFRGRHRLLRLPRRARTRRLQAGAAPRDRARRRPRLRPRRRRRPASRRRRASSSASGSGST